MFLGGLSRNNIDSNADYADGVILVYNITNHTSFDGMTRFLEELRRHAKKRQAIILIGNKSDSENDCKVKIKEARVFAEKKNLIFRKMSALEGTNFDDALKDLLTRLVNNTGTNIGTNTDANTITITSTSTTTSNIATNDNTNNCKIM